MLNKVAIERVYFKRLAISLWVIKTSDLYSSIIFHEVCKRLDQPLTFRHRASCILGQAFHYSPENAFYIFNQQIYFIT